MLYAYEGNKMHSSENDAVLTFVAKSQCVSLILSNEARNANLDAYKKIQNAISRQLFSFVKRETAKVF